MQLSRANLNEVYYRLWELGLQLPEPDTELYFHVKFNIGLPYHPSNPQEFSTVYLKAKSDQDALERTCLRVSQHQEYRPEDVYLHSVYDSNQKLIWIDEDYESIIELQTQLPINERRKFLKKMGISLSAIAWASQSQIAQAIIPFGFVRSSKYTFNCALSSGTNIVIDNTWLTNQGWLGKVGKVTVTVTGDVISSTTATPALQINTSLPAGSTFTLNIGTNGRIIGRGGNGGDHSRTPGAGGIGLQVSTASTIINNGLIAGGGGGGAGGVHFYTGGGGGGGGAGGGTGGLGGIDQTSGYNRNGTNGNAGSLTNGGNGGRGGGPNPSDNLNNSADNSESGYNTYSSPYGAGSGASYPGYQRGSSGGGGGAWGSSGGNACGYNSSLTEPGAAGGNAVTGNSNIVWTTPGNRYGAVS